VIKTIVSHVFERYHKLQLVGKLVLWLLILFYIALGAIIIFVSPARIAQTIYNKADLLASSRYGWLTLGTAIVIVSFPPVIGHTTLCTLAGFAYGMNGFFITGTASLIGSALSFTVLRLLFKKRLHAWSSKNEKWQALESVVKAKGLPLIILIRVSPIPPWVYSNSLFASIQAVKLWQFVFATFCVFPKILLETFIGSKMAELSDGKQRGHMDTATKILDATLIIGGIFIAFLASWTVYYLVQSHMRNLEGFPEEVDALAAEAIEHFDEESPLLSGAEDHD